MRRAMVFRARRPAAPVYSAPAAADPFAFDRFLFNPHILSMGYEYGIDSEDGQPLMVVRKRLFSFVLRVDVFAASDDRHLLSVCQDSPFQLFYSTYTVTDDMGRPVAAIRRDPFGPLGIFWSSWNTGTWSVSGSDLSPVAMAQIDPQMLVYNWVITAPTGAVLGFWRRRLTLTDKHRLDLSPDITRSLDRRCAIALGVLLEFGNRR